MNCKKVFLPVVLFFISLNLSAQNYNDALRLSEPEIFTSARSLAMGNAYTAVSNDFSASLFNPAGFALIKNAEFSGGLQHNSFNNRTSFFNNSVDDDRTSARLNQFGFAFPFPTHRGSFVIGFGYNRIKDFNRTTTFNGYNNNNNSMIQDLAYYNDDIAYELGLSYPVYDAGNNYLGDETRINGKLNQSGNIYQEGGLNTWSFSGAMEIEENIFVGATLNILSGDFKRNREYTETDIYDNYGTDLLLDPEEPATADFESFYFNDIIDWDISGWNATLGLLAKVDDNVNVGFTIKLPKSYTIKEIYYVDAYSNFGTGTQFILDPPTEDRIEYDISTPYEITVGGSFKDENYLVSADINFIDYTQMEFTDGLELSTRVENNRNIDDFFRAVYNLHAGAEYIIPNTSIAVRGGFMLLQSPFEDDPSEYDKKIVTAGFGFGGGKGISFNFAYSYGWWKDFGDNYGSGESRTYQDITKSNLMFGIKYNF